MMIIVAANIIDCLLGTKHLLDIFYKLWLLIFPSVFVRR